MLPLSSLFRFFFKDRVTSGGVTELSFARSVVISLAKEDDTIGADTGRGDKFVVDESAKCLFLELFH